MWFHICLSNMCAPLSCLVGKGGTLYFRLVDVGILLGCSNPHSFANKYRTLLGSQVLPDGFHYPINTRRCKLVDMATLYNVLSGKPLRTLFHNAIHHGKFIVQNDKARHCNYFKYCVRLVASEDGNVRFFEWVEDFVAEVTRRRNDIVPSESLTDSDYGSIQSATTYSDSGSTRYEMASTGSESTESTESVSQETQAQQETREVKIESQIGETREVKIESQIDSQETHEVKIESQETVTESQTNEESDYWLGNPLTIDVPKEETPDNPDIKVETPMEIPDESSETTEHNMYPEEVYLVINGKHVRYSYAQ